MSRIARQATVALCLLLTLTVGANILPVARGNGASQDIVVEDFSDITTTTDLGLNDFSGNMGSLNKTYVEDLSLQCASGIPPCALRFAWNFQEATEDYTGLFLSLFGLTDTLASFDGVTATSLSFPEHSLNLDRIDGPVNTSLPGRAVEQVCFTLVYASGNPVRLKAELRDTQQPTQGFRSHYVTINPGQAPQSFCWSFRSDFAPGTPDLDPQRAKVLSFIIERQNIGAGVLNPQTGTLDLQRVWLTTNQPEVQPVDDDELLDLLELRAYQYFVDWSSRKPGSADIPQDRSSFGDLLTVGGVGFALPAHIIAAERGWTSRAEARAHILNVLRVLDQPAAFGPERVGRIGYQGWFYHFLGTDGRRKQNFDFPDTTDRDESRNTVELSSIDTGLALMGVLAAQSYFTGDELEEIEVRTRAQAIYDRVNWNFMLEQDKQQFYLGWKPNELRDGPPFEVPDVGGLGKYSGYVTGTQTLDFYTDEALIIALLALGSTQEPTISPEIYSALVRQCDLDMDPDVEMDLIKTFPGALFTYQFLLAFVDTRVIWTRPSCGDTSTWFKNTQVATLRAIAYAEQNRRGYATYGPDAWGISAAEGPFDAYHAYGAPPLAAWDTPEEDGTITYYGMVSAVSLGGEQRARAISAVRNAWSRGDWHPRFGLPDAFNDNIGQANPPADALRKAGPWKQRALFAIDQGPMLLHLENARSGLVWKLFARNPNIQRGWERLYERAHLPLVRR